MKQLVAINTNIYYTKDEQGKETKYNELVFITDHAVYNYSNQGEIVRERKLEEQRFVVKNENIKGIIGTLTKLMEATEKDLS